MLLAENRLKGSGEFSTILKEGQRVRTPHLLLAARKKTGSSPRVGVMVSKKVAKKAVERNQVRRVIAHVFMHLFQEEKRFDVVVSVQRIPSKTIYSVLEKELTEWQKRLPSG